MSSITDSLWSEIFNDEKQNVKDTYNKLSKCSVKHYNDELSLKLYDRYLIYFGTLPHDYCEVWDLSYEFEIAVSNTTKCKSPEELELHIKTLPEYRIDIREEKLDRINLF
jgi:hypothetical protein